MKTLTLAASVILLLASTLLPACSDTAPSVAPVADTDAGADAGSACASAGGACVLGSAACASLASSGAQDCNPSVNPGGAFCCLALGDAGPGGDAGPSACVAAGGKCVAVTPGSCAGGTVLDATHHSCGTGLGVECCRPGVDAGGAGPFACGASLSCDGRSQICHVTEGGAVQPDGGAHVSYACAAIPSACASNVTCTCVQPATSTQLCSESSGDVTVTTQAP